MSTVFSGKREHLMLAYAAPGVPRRFADLCRAPDRGGPQVERRQSSAFSDLYYAIYLGRYETPSNLLTYDFSHLPPTGDTAKVTVPFGDSDITIVTAARGQLAGTLPALLPWIFGALGLLLTIAAAWTAERLVRRRRSAERDTDEIGRLYGELGTLYGEQRTIALTLQRALLPSDTPEIAGLEVAVQYVPGTTGMEIGGDWYSVIALDEQRFAFVIGDVSGRGAQRGAGHGLRALHDPDICARGLPARGRCSKSAPGT